MSYLIPFVHLSIHSMTRIVSDGREVLIQKIPKRRMWKVSTPIFEGRGEFPKETHDCLRLVQQLRWDDHGMLEIDAVVGTIHWTEEVCPDDFRVEFPRFLKKAQEWADILTKELLSSERLATN